MLGGDSLAISPCNGLAGTFVKHLRTTGAAWSASLFRAIVAPSYCRIHLPAPFRTRRLCGYFDPGSCSSDNADCGRPDSFERIPSSWRQRSSGQRIYRGSPSKPGGMGERNLVRLAPTHFVFFRTLLGYTGVGDNPHAHGLCIRALPI